MTLAKCCNKNYNENFTATKINTIDKHKRWKIHFFHVKEMNKKPHYQIYTITFLVQKNGHHHFSVFSKFEIFLRKENTKYIPENRPATEFQS